MPSIDTRIAAPIPDPVEVVRGAVAVVVVVAVAAAIAG
jgi:hypothetical protein